MATDKISSMCKAWNVIHIQWVMTNTQELWNHYSDVIMSAMASQITSLTNVYSTVYSGADQRKHQSSASLALVRGIHRWPVNSPHKWPVTRKKLRFDDVIMCRAWILACSHPVNLDKTRRDQITHRTDYEIYQIKFIYMIYIVYRNILNKQRITK